MKYRRCCWLWRAGVAIFLVIYLTGCISKTFYVTPSLPGEPTLDERVLYSFIISMIKGDWRTLHVLTTPEAYEQAQRWWQHLDPQDRRWFRANVNLALRIGEVLSFTGRNSNIYIVSSAPVVLYVNFLPCEYHQSCYQEAEVEGEEKYVLRSSFWYGETFYARFTLFVVNMRQIQIERHRVTNWEQICWQVYPYPGEGMLDEKIPKKPLRCFSP